jgi:hypothetical protein
MSQHQVFKETAKSKVAHRVALATSFLGQSASQVRLSDPCRPSDQNVSMMINPVARSERKEQLSIKATARTKINIFDACTCLAQLGLAKPCLQTAIVFYSHFTIDEKPQTVLEREILHVRHLKLFLEGFRHTFQSKGTELIQCRVAQHDESPWL